MVQYLNRWQPALDTAQVVATFRSGAPLLLEGDQLTIARVTFVVTHCISGLDTTYGQTVVLRRLAEGEALVSVRSAAD